jgi:hypothetical protein
MLWQQEWLFNLSLQNWHVLLTSLAMIVRNLRMHVLGIFLVYSVATALHLTLS